jgi:secreted trypsin-like serine protease
VAPSPPHVWKRILRQFPVYSVAVWHLGIPIQPSDTIKYAKIVAQGYDPPDGLNATTAGWGNTAPDQSSGSDELRWVNVPIVSRQDCEQYGQITSNMLCAGGEEGKGSCPNDSGGPIWNSETCEILGTVHSGGGCGEKGLPIVYTNLGTLGDWVRENSWSV